MYRVVDVLHGGMDAAYGSQYYSNIVTSIIENHYDAMHNIICLKNASIVYDYSSNDMADVLLY